MVEHKFRVFSRNKKPNEIILYKVNSYISDTVWTGSSIASTKSPKKPSDKSGTLLRRVDKYIDTSATNLSELIDEHPELFI